jgi:hypothetical protein
VLTNDGTTPISAASARSLPSPAQRRLPNVRHLYSVRRRCAGVAR